MHLLSSIGGTREEQLCILSAVLLWGVVAWLFTVRAARKTNNNITANDNNLEAPLLEEDEPKHAIRSRVRLAARQAAYEVEFKEAQLDQAVARIHGKHDEAKAVVLDLVSSFLFPEVGLGPRTHPQATARTWARVCMPLPNAQPLARAHAGVCLGPLPLRHVCAGGPATQDPC